MSEHEFEIGKLVSIISRKFLSPATPRQFLVQTRLPNIGGVSQYRIFNKECNHERVELGSNLKAIDGIVSNDTKTFEGAIGC